jgi:hypothetical protein
MGNGLYDGRVSPVVDGFVLGAGRLACVDVRFILGIGDLRVGGRAGVTTADRRLRDPFGVRSAGPGLREGLLLRPCVVLGVECRRLGPAVREHGLLLGCGRFGRRPSQGLVRRCGGGIRIGRIVH